MIEQIKIDDSEAKRILDLEESHYLDLKSVDITPAKLTQAVSAFANTAGGELFIGIEESGRNGKKLGLGAALPTSRKRTITFK
jgi:ATP-dependent DNA helicase RecG